MTTQRRSGGGFTLIELLVVVAIIGVLASLLLPALRTSVTSARIAQCLGNQRQCGMAILGFANEHRDRLPPVRGYSPNASASATFYDSTWCDVISNYCALRDFNKVILCPVPEMWRAILFPNYGVWMGTLNSTLGWTGSFQTTSSYSCRLTDFTRGLDAIWMVGDTRRYLGGDVSSGYYEAGSLTWAPVVDINPRASYRHGGAYGQEQGRVNITFMDGHGATWTREDVAANRAGILDPCHGPQDLKIWPERPWTL